MKSKLDSYFQIELVYLFYCVIYFVTVIIKIELHAHRQSFVYFVVNVKNTVI